LALSPDSIVRRVAESIPGEQRFGAKEGAQIKRSKSDMSNNNRFFSENTRALATAKIGPKNGRTGRDLLLEFLKPEPCRDALDFFFSWGRLASKKMLQ
jgi:hypothetical protein